ncbi:hypothetical protein Tco_0216367 [Tanacetum coccineum]
MANQEENPPQQEQPFVAAKQVGFNLEDIILNTNNEVALLYPEHTNKKTFKCVSDFISMCCLREPFTRSPNMYKEYLAKFWDSAKALENSKVSFSIPTGGIYGEVGVNTFRNAIGIRRQFLPKGLSKRAFFLLSGAKPVVFKALKPSSNASKKIDASVPSAGQAGTQLAKGEKNTNQTTISQLIQRKATKNANLNKQQSKPTPPPTTSIIPPIEEDAKAKATKHESEVRKEELVDLLGLEVVNKYYNDKLQYDRYCDKMLNRRVESRITSYDVLTNEGPITLKVYREDGTSKVIPNFKASDLHLGEWREVMNACPNRTGKGWKIIYDHIRLRMDYIHTAKAELANKRLKSSVQYEDHLAGTMLNEPDLGMIMFNSYHRQDFVTIEDLRDFSNTMLYTIQKIFFRRHQGLGLDDHARTFSALLLAEINKRNLSPLKHIRTIEQLRQ